MKRSDFDMMLDLFEMLERKKMVSFTVFVTDDGSTIHLGAIEDTHLHFDFDTSDTLVDIRKD